MIGVAGFKKDPKYLLKDNWTRIAILAAINTALALWLEPSWKSFALYAVPIYFLSKADLPSTVAGLVAGLVIHAFDTGFASTDLLWTLVAAVMTFPLTALYHGCAHQAFRPAWLNRVLGEAAGMVHTTSIDEWTVIHYYHHKFPDRPGLDPHPPRGQTFAEFAQTTGKTIFATFKTHFFEAHRDNPDIQTVLRINPVLVLVRQNAMTIFWFLVLSPNIFLYWFGFNVIFKKLHYAWFNWATHVKRNDSEEIVNLDSGIYRLINSISFNLYYHKNHHLSPSLLNPKKLKRASSNDRRAA